MKKIFLVGMMGCGKSTVGRLLADKLAFSFLDTDDFIVQKEGKSIRALFETEGEAYFRLLEQKVIESLPAASTVVACGGGLPCYHDLMAQLKELGTVVYLSVPIDVLVERLKNDTDRPLWKIKVQFEQLFIERQAVYQQAHYLFDGQLAPSILADKMIEVLKEQHLV